MRDILLSAILLVSAGGASTSEAAAYPKDPPSLAAWQESLLDGETLKACLLERIWGENDVMYKGWTPWDLAIWFREEAGDLPDERVHAALTEIYREAEAREGKESRELMTRAALWLGVCSDDATKTFLLDVAADASKDGFLRTTALSSYLRNANAGEVKDALIRFLVEDGGGINRLSVYVHARAVFDSTDPTNAAKRQAILATLLVAANREEEKIGFMEVDGVLSKRSDAYRRSRERLAMLERHSLEPPTRNVHTDRDLKAALEEARKFESYTSVNTNLTALKDRDFNQPLPEDDWASLTIPPPAVPADGAMPADKPQPTRRTGRTALGVAALVALAAAGVWVFRRRRGVSRP